MSDDAAELFPGQPRLFRVRLTQEIDYEAVIEADSGPEAASAIGDLIRAGLNAQQQLLDLGPDIRVTDRGIVHAWAHRADAD